MLRDYGSRLIARMYKNFHTSTNNLQTRVIQLFSDALQNHDTQFSSMYGVIAGLCELGTDVIRMFIVPRLKFISDRIEALLQDSSIITADRIAADRIRTRLRDKCSPVLKIIRISPDDVIEYK